ncbi:MAG: hypothetical protein PHH87_02710 [Desulfuromonas sp.]|nr:hypothetical protein [Desulfuromonas sp.]
MKFTKLFSAIALFGSMAATAHASTVVTVNVKNSTATQAEYTYEYFAGSVNPTPGTIQPSATSTFQLTSGSELVSGMRFVYTSGSKKCRFAASHTVNPMNGVPTFNKSGASIGTSRATCNANISAVQPTPPFNFTVAFEIK